MTPLELHARRDGGSSILTLRGRLDSSSSLAFKQFVQPHLFDATPSLILDLRGLQFISSAGVRELVLVARALDARGRKGVLVGQSDSVRDVLNLAGVHALFHQADDLDAARADRSMIP